MAIVVYSERVCPFAWTVDLGPLTQRYQIEPVAPPNREECAFADGIDRPIWHQEADFVGDSHVTRLSVIDPGACAPDERVPSIGQDGEAQGAAEARAVVILAGDVGAGGRTARSWWRKPSPSEAADRSSVGVPPSGGTDRLVRR